MARSVWRDWRAAVVTARSMKAMCVRRGERSEVWGESVEERGERQERWKRAEVGVEVGGSGGGAAGQVCWWDVGVRGWERARRERRERRERRGRRGRRRRESMFGGDGRWECCCCWGVYIKHRKV